MLFSEHVFSYLATLLKAVLSVVCLIVKLPVLSPTSGETPIKSTHACFPYTDIYTRAYVGLRVDFLSCGPVKKFTGASFFTDTPACLNISNKHP